MSPSTGLRKGVVVNIESTLRSVKAAIEDAEMMSGREVSSCWTGIGGSHIEGINSRGVVAVTEKNREISPDDKERVIEVAQKVSIPMDRQVLEVIPQSYIVDNQKGIRNPLNMIGVRLEAEVFIITCSVTSGQNLLNCVNRAGYRVNNLIPKSLAAGRSVLTDEEKDLGVALIDLGGGTTEVMAYSAGSPYSIITIPVGGAQVTSDISIIKSIALDTAERIKIESGCCWEGLLEEDEEIIVPGVGGRSPLPIPRSQLLAIIRPRMEEIFKMVKEKLDKLSQTRPLGGGIVLTGGGALLSGAAELASHVFKLPVRIGNPLSVGGLAEECRTPVYATAVGLVLMGKDKEDNNLKQDGEKGLREKNPSPFGRLKGWISKEFF
ncbi:cell division protein FtsA [Spirochaetia bacterium]|nr:cell division protein FtsA [Spirochaetia bacterium]